MIKFLRSKSTIVAFLSGMMGIVLILWAWQLPPFVSTLQKTDNALIKGNITLISPQISGIVTRVYVQDYQKVEKGMVLFELDDTLFRHQLVQAQAILEAKKAKLASVLLQIKLLEKEINTLRTKMVHSQKLSKNELSHPKNLNSQKALPLSSSSPDLSETFETKSQLQKKLEFEQQGLQSDIAGAKAGVEVAELNLAHTKIISPAVGHIGSVSVQVGQYVVPGMRLVAIVPEDIWIIAHYKETQIADMRIGQPVVFYADALNNQKLTGRLVSFAPATRSEFSLLGTETANGNFIKIAQRISIRIAIDQEQEGIKKLIPGMSVVTYVDTASHHSRN
ncbi:HlyD family secretion protein [Bartonella sp. AR 15-3]|uniref:HlyD family secretion protein n=1 Tax=Bartonella sp. AR 15-3 TaxID=545617 RepID=UPI0001F4BBC6|nr:HlyD family secretion protein [Bartonella sp. AR 15-3]OPB32268.1 Multidrug resistance efflux pump [Bartonella sp. AR 15-3]CBI79925.1 Transport protein transmembrane [Bartonella sp. AR 15-3]